MLDWYFAPELVLILLGLILAYAACIGPLRGRFPGATPVSATQIQLFGLGWLSIVVALTSPIETLSSISLTMHMTQHLLLTLAAPPLLLLGTPRWMLRPFLRIPGMLEIGRFLTSFGAAFFLYNFIFLVWHAPRFYDSAVESLPIHVLEHAMFFFSAVLTWWPLCSPLDELPCAPAGVQVVYCFLQTFPPTILGAILAFASNPIYTTYARAPRLWGLSAMSDQQLAGLIMWIPGSLLFFAILTVVFIRWLNRDEYGQRTTRQA